MFRRILGGAAETMTTITILRTSDGSKHEIAIRLSETLNDLKSKISKYPSLTTTSGECLQPRHQRLFYLGRELKTGKRSLSTLGIGKHDIFLIHLMPNQPDTLELSSDDEEDDEDVVVVKNWESSSSTSTSSKSSERKRLNADIHDGAVDEIESRIRKQQQNRDNVVDLLDSDDNDDAVKVWESNGSTTSKSYRRGMKRSIKDVNANDNVNVMKKTNKKQNSSGGDEEVVNVRSKESRIKRQQNVNNSVVDLLDDSEKNLYKRKRGGNHHTV